MLKRYTVRRDHIGDDNRYYTEGDIREAQDQSVKSLIDSGVLTLNEETDVTPTTPIAPPGTEALKTAPPLQNKMDAPLPAKADPAPITTPAVAAPDTK